MSNLEETFGSWLKVVLPHSGTSERDLRLGVIRKFISAFNKGEVLDLVFAFYSAAKEKPAVERLRAAMRDIDTSFGPKDDAEFAVLAAGIFFLLFEQGGDLAVTAALAILCADFGVPGGTNHITEIVTKARHFIGAEGIRLREESVAVPPLREVLQSLLEPEEEGEDDVADGEKATSFRHLVNALAENGDNVERSLASIEMRRAEQSDILYWLLSGRRNIAGVPLKGLRVEQVTLFVAVELARITRQIPGPASASAILSSLLEQCKNPNTKEVTLEACIQPIEAADGMRYLTKQKVVDPLITPISFALAKAEETGWQEGWQHAVKTQTRKPASTKYFVLGIAEQLYREVLLSRALGEN